VDEDTRLALLSYHAEEVQVTIRITYPFPELQDCIRTRPSKFLAPILESENVPLMHADNIGIYLHWKL